MPLTPKQQRFIDEYLKDRNGSAAAIRAGYSQISSRVTASRMLSRDNIKAEISRRVGRVAEKHDITLDRIVRELALLGFSNMADYMKAGANGDPYLDFAALSRDQTAALHEVTVEDFVDGRGEDAREVKRVKFKLYDKRAALVDLGKHLGMFSENVRVVGADGGPVSIEVNFVEHQPPTIDVTPDRRG